MRSTQARGAFYNARDAAPEAGWRDSGLMKSSTSTDQPPSAVANAHATSELESLLRPRVTELDQAGEDWQANGQKF